jgi:hypothetical protein
MVRVPPERRRISVLPYIHSLLNESQTDDDDDDDDMYTTVKSDFFHNIPGKFIA